MHAPRFTISVVETSGTMTSPNMPT